MEINEKPVWRKYDDIHVYCRDQFASSLPDSDRDLREWLKTRVIILRSNEKKESGLVVWPDNRAFFIKGFRVDSLLQKWVYLLFSKYAEKSFRLSQDLIKAGVSTPGPVAVIRDFGAARGSVYFVCEALTNALTFRKYLKREDNFQKKRNILNRVAREIAAMHEAGFFHGDLKWKNIMLGPGPEYRSFYIDLDSAGRLRSKTDRRFARDLARFCVDMAENHLENEHVSDFIISYSQAAGKDPANVARNMASGYRKISSRHKDKYGTDTPPLKFNP